MSYYTFFYPKKEQYNPDNLTDLQISSELKKAQESIEDYRLAIKRLMVSIYYNPADLNKLSWLWKVLIMSYKEYHKYQTIQWIESELKEYQTVAINHANDSSEYMLKDDIAEADVDIHSYYEKLVVLSAVRFNKEENPNSSEMEYLQEDYQSKIEEFMDAVSEIIDTQSTDQFILDNYSTKKTEQDLQREEEQKEKQKEEQQKEPQPNEPNEPIMPNKPINPNEPNDPKNKKFKISNSKLVIQN